jgi:hypothetical protein
MSLSSCFAHAAQLKGNSLTNQKFSAILDIEKGKPVKGKVKFKVGKKAVFRAYDGTEVQLRIRPICAQGANSELETCWPDLAIEMDDLTARSGTLKILEQPPAKKK